MKALLQTEHCMANGKTNLCIVLAAGLLSLFLPEFFLLGVQWGLMFLLSAAPLNAAQHRLKSRWNRYLLTMPYSRRQVVNARYLYYLAAAFGSAVWILLLCSLIRIFRSSFLGSFLLRSAGLSIGITLFMLAINLLLSILMDHFEKQWLYGIGIGLYPFLFFGAFFMALMGENTKISASVILTVAIVLLLLLALSYVISLAAYCGGFRRKEDAA